MGNEKEYINNKNYAIESQGKKSKKCKKEYYQIFWVRKTTKTENCCWNKLTHQK